MYAFTQDVPIDAAFYERIRTGLGDELPEGLILHLAVEKPEGGLRYYDVWESEEAWDRFGEDRLHPVVHEMLAEIFGDELPDEPDRLPLPVIHIWGPGHGAEPNLERPRPVECQDAASWHSPPGTN